MGSQCVMIALSTTNTIYKDPQRSYHKYSIIIENHSLHQPWETEEDVYCGLLENTHLRRRIYHHAQPLYGFPKGIVLVDHELLESPLYLTHSSTDQNFKRLLHKRLERKMVEQERQRLLGEAAN